MKIGYDAKRAFLNSTGLGNYSRWLLKSLTSYAPVHQYHLYTPKTKTGSWLQLLQALPSIIIHQPVSLLFTSWWRTRGIIADLKSDNIELYHGLSHELPLGIHKSGVTSIVTVHDVIVLRFPKYYGWLNRKIYTAKLRYACRAADRIIAISQQTREDLITLLHVNPAKISVIYQNCDASFRHPTSAAHQQEARRKYNLPEQYLLTVGTIEERKNLLLLVRALKSIPGSTQLVVVGKPTPYLETVKAYLQQEALTHKVIFLHQVPFIDLPAIYQLASVFVYPSRYEGFGIPVLEALNSGVPVIAATGSCLEEAGGPNSLYIHPDDAADLAQKITLLLGDYLLREQMIARGRMYAEHFNDNYLAQQMITLYQQTLQQHAKRRSS